MKTEYTPGPWTLQPLAENVWNATHHAAAKGRELPVAMIHGEANARLIAAAPDMLAALQAIVSNPDMADGEEPRRLVTDARAAIAKALGK